MWSAVPHRGKYMFLAHHYEDVLTSACWDTTNTVAYHMTVLYIHAGHFFVFFQK